MSTQKPEITQTEVIANTRLFTVESVHLNFSNGEQRVYERIRGQAIGAVMMVPMLDDDRFLLVREYAVGVDDYVLSLPKGLLEPNEDVCSAANRELMEEVGFGAKCLTPLKQMSTAPGYMGSGMQLILAENLYPQKLEGDEPEPLEVIEWRLSDLAELVEREDFSEARSIAALFLVRDLKNQP